MKTKLLSRSFKLSTCGLCSRSSAYLLLPIPRPPAIPASSTQNKFSCFRVFINADSPPSRLSTSRVYTWKKKKNPTQVSRYKVKNKQFVINLTIALLLIFKPQDTLNKIWGSGKPNQVIWWFTAHVRAHAHRSRGCEEKSGRWQSKQQGALLPTVPSSRVSRVPSTVTSE